MRKLMLFLAALVLASTPAWAGPNAGGTLVIHDANLLMSATDGTQPVCGQGTIPTTCAEVDGRVDGGTSKWLVTVYAAFAEGASPRLMGVTWGLSYDGGQLFLSPYDKCGDFELYDEGWPAPNKGSSVTWNEVQTSLMVPIYWFGAYTYGASVTLDAAPHPAQGGFFGDDSVPAVLDAITGYSKLGFDTDGDIRCPTVPQGACCDPDTRECTLTTPLGCSAPNIFLSDETSCDPNPCPFPLAACCVDTVCAMYSEPDCVTAGGIYQGPGTDCPTTTCFGACCDNITGECQRLLETDCGPGHSFQGLGTDCDPNPCSGACCDLNSGDCEVTTETLCSSPRVWQGPSTDCDPNPCMGACCDPDYGTCELLGEASCLDNFLGPGTVCVPNPCPQPYGACCAPNGSCLYRRADQCVAPNEFQGAGVLCNPNPCPAPEAACCNGTSCTVTLQVDCTGVWMPTEPDCSPNPCLPTGACCTGEVCALGTEETCTKPSVFYGADTVCDPNPCLLGACCVGDVCTVTTETFCAGTWFYPISCTPNPCGLPVGACCIYLDGTCVVTLEQLCVESHEFPWGYQGDGTLCDPSPCPVVTGACCRPDGLCQLFAEEACFPPNIWSGPHSVCVPNPCPQPTGACCDHSTGDCTVTLQVDCQAPRDWIGPLTTCPDDCVVPVDTSTWGRIKARYR